MTADVTQDRRVTAPNQGFHTVLVDGSRLFWALLSPVHERLGYRAVVPDRIQGDAVLPHSSFTAQSRITSHRSSRDQSPRPSSFAPGSPPSRPGLATTQLAAAAQRRPALTAAARGASAEPRSGRRNASVELRNSPTRTIPAAQGVRGLDLILPLDFPLPIQG